MDILFSEQDVKEAFEKMADSIRVCHFDNLFIIGILTGGVYSTFKTMDKLSCDFEYGFMAYKSYDNGILAKTDPKLNYSSFKITDIENKQIILIDDIMDTGKTISAALLELSKRNIKDIHVVTLLEKINKGKIIIPKDINFSFYSGLKMENDDFVIGCGMGFGEKFRNLKNILKINKNEAIIDKTRQKENKHGNSKMEKEIHMC